MELENVSEVSLAAAAEYEEIRDLAMTFLGGSLSLPLFATLMWSV